MDKRRLQRTGGSSLTVTIPKKWVTQHELTEKDQVLMYAQTSGALLIKTAPRSTRAQKPAVLSLANLTPAMITREATALYIAGVEEIEFRHPTITKEQRAHIRRSTYLFMGFEIVDESADRVTIRNILDVTKLTIPDTIDKMVATAQSMMKDAVTAVMNNAAEASSDMADRDREIDKLYLVIKRQFHSALSDQMSEEELHLDRSDLNYYSTIAAQLERIADHAVKVARLVRIESRAMVRPTAALYTELLDQLLATMTEIGNIIHAPNRTAAHHMLNKSTVLEKNIAALARTSNPPLAARVILNDSFDRMLGYLINIAESIIDRSVRQ